MKHIKHISRYCNISLSGLASAGKSFMGGGGGDLLSLGAGLYSDSKNRRHSKEMARNSILWRVQDAKNAGIHPLFALGASVGNSPSMSTALPQAANRVADRIQRRSERTAQQPLLEAQINSANASAKKDLIQSQLNESQTALFRNQLDSQLRDSQVGSTYKDFPNQIVGSPNDIVEPTRSSAAKRPGVQAGYINMWQETVDADGNKHYVPSEQMMQTLQEGGWLLAAHKNTKHWTRKKITDAWMALPHWARTAARTYFTQPRR